jgi:hypothetical protein
LKRSPFSEDICEFLKLLSSRRVRYVIVGGEAVIYYGYARLTGGVDVFFEPTPANAKKLHGALTEFWGGRIPGLGSSEELRRPGVLFRFGVPPNRLELLNDIDGVTFDEAWRGRKSEPVRCGDADVVVFYIGLQELIRNKRAAGRNKDLDDLEFLDAAAEGRAPEE